MSEGPNIVTYFDQTTCTATHLVVDPATRCATIVDPVLNYDPVSGRTSTECADLLLENIERRKLQVEWVVETHVHADHLTAGPYLKSRVGGKSGIGEHVIEVQKTFADLFQTGPEFHTDGSQFDRLFADGDVFSCGELELAVMHTPGHTPACVTYLVADCALVGDTLLMPDLGTARTDFPGGNATDLFHSARRILSLPDATRLLHCHDYTGHHHDHYVWESSVAQQRAENIYVADGATVEAFVAIRQARDATLALPRLVIPAIQVNMRGGAFPPPEANGVSYLKVPLNLFESGPVGQTMQPPHQADH